MKKSANEYQTTATSKSGVIDTNALHKYKLTDDIFRRIQVVPEGKNHGLIFLLDWSGSMQYELLETLKQCYNLVWFCDRVKIPYVVYAFSDQWVTHGYTTYNGTVDSKIQDGSKSSDMCIEDIEYTRYYRQHVDDGIIRDTKIPKNVISL